jgi:hypothetical protein
MHHVFSMRCGLYCGGQILSARTPRAHLEARSYLENLSIFTALRLDFPHLLVHKNGKGVLKEMLQAATGGYFGGMPKDAVVTAPGQKPSLKNAPTNYIYDLMGVGSPRR